MQRLCVDLNMPDNPADWPLTDSAANRLWD